MAINRRDALKAMGGLAGAAALGKVLPGCGGGDSGPVGLTTTIVLMMENRSYDHLLGARTLLEGKAGDGLVASMSNKNRQGTDIPIFQVGGHDAVCVEDPPHDWDSCHSSFDAGRNDGFVAAYEAAYNDDALTQVMGYLTRDHQPATWALADAYCTNDRYFCSVMGPTWPNRMYWHTGTSMGIKDNHLPPTGFSWSSIYHRLATKNVEYSYYYGDVPVLSVIKDLPGVTDRIFRMSDFFDHAKAGKLAPVVYIDPAFSANDDHPPKHTILGQQLIASIYVALSTSPQWKNCQFFITYDEHGGFFDHVAPSAGHPDEFTNVGFDQQGFRVPALLVGPYAKQGVVSTPMEHCSVLKYFQDLYGLDPLYMRVDAATPIDDMIDMNLLMAGTPNPPAPIPAVEVNESDITANCMAAMARADDHPILQLADARPDLFGKLDRRAHVAEYLHDIGDFLDQHNMGRIVRGK